MSQPVFELPQLSHLPDVHRTQTRDDKVTRRLSNALSQTLRSSSLDLQLQPTSETQGDLVTGKSRTAAVIASVTCITGLGTLLSGILTVGIPVMAKDLHMSASLELWPASIYALTCGCTLLLLGAIADVIGCRRMYLMGTLLQSAFTLGCGLSSNGMQLIIFRGLAGVAASFCLPSAVSIITNTFEVGPRRNMAFAAMGGGQPIGFSLGLTLGGVYADTIGWRWGFHMAAILNTFVLVVAIWALPTDIDEPVIPWGRLQSDIDWIGALLISTSLAMLSYVFAVITGSIHSIKAPTNIGLLATAGALLPIFVFWVGRQEKLSRPALIPNSLWKSGAFTSVTVTVFLVWGAFNAVEQILAFYLQYVLGVSAIKSSVYFLPAPVAGALANIFIGLLLPRLRTSWTVWAACVLSGLPSLLLATIARVDGPTYWACVFPAMFLNPIACDVLYTIANLLITESFPKKTQALAGGVFGTISQIGKSVGLASTAMIAASVTNKLPTTTPEEERLALFLGYRAGFWYCFGLSIVTLLSAWGLRNVRRLGVKTE